MISINKESTAAAYSLAGQKQTDSLAAEWEPMESASSMGKKRIKKI